MLVIPINEQDSTTISKSFSDAPFYALLDLDIGNFLVVKNENSLSSLKDSGATCAIFYSDSDSEIKSCKDEELQVFSSDKSICSIDEIYFKMNNRAYKEL